jgi:hypothetical protein
VNTYESKYYNNGNEALAPISHFQSFKRSFGMTTQCSNIVAMLCTLCIILLELLLVNMGVYPITKSGGSAATLQGNPCDSNAITLGCG